MTDDFAARIGALAGVAVAGVREVGTRHGFRHLTGELADGRAVFVKAAVGGGAAEAFAAEANGLRWLARAGAVPVPAVLGADESTLVIELLPPANRRRARPATSARRWQECTPPAHPAFGAPWPGYIASLPLDNTASGEPDWGSWYARATARSLPEAGTRRRRANAGRRAPGRGRHRPDRRAGRPARAAESHSR